MEVLARKGKYICLEHHTIPVGASTDRDKVSTATTWVDLLFHGQYLRQFAVDTSFQE